MDLTIAMLQTSTILFALAALGGLAMAVIRIFRHRNPPSWLALTHGLLATAGLTLLLFATFVGQEPPEAMLAAILFLIAAAGGVWLNLKYHVHGIPLSLGIVLAHAVLALAAFALLFRAAYGWG